MKRYLAYFLGFFGAILIVQGFHHFAHAQTTLLPFDQNLYPGVSPDFIQGSGAQGVVTTLRGLISTLKQLLAPVLIFIIGSFAIQLVLAGGNEEDFNKVSKNFLYLLAGTAFVVFADYLSQALFLYRDFAGAPSTFLSGTAQIDTTTAQLTGQLRLGIKFLRYVLGGIALFYMVKSGSVIIFAAAEEETVNKEKEIFSYGFVGFILIMISEAIINVLTISPQPGVSFPQIEVQVGGGIELITNITNVLLVIMGSLSLFTLVVGGAMYAFTAGNEERGQQATKLIYGSLLGLVIAFSSYTIVSEFSRGVTVQFESEEALLEEIRPPVGPPSTTPLDFNF